MGKGVGDRGLGCMSVRRLILTKVGWLLVGAAVSIGVAWWCVARAHNIKPGGDLYRWTLPQHGIASRVEWPWIAPTLWPQSPEHHWTTGTLGFESASWSRVVAPSTYRSKSDDPTSVEMTTTSAGLPWHVLSASDQFDSTTQWATRASWSSGIVVQSDPVWARGLQHRNGDFWYRLPIRPIWPMIIAQSALYGAACWAAWTGIVGSLTYVRGKLRAATGRCASCGYDLRGLQTGSLCPECGAQSARRSGTPCFNSSNSAPSQ